jgi:hypothetical protein
MLSRPWVVCETSRLSNERSGSLLYEQVWAVKYHCSLRNFRSAKGKKAFIGMYCNTVPSYFHEKSLTDFMQDEISGSDGGDYEDG